MATKRLSIGGILVSISADATSANFSFSLGKGLWRTLFKILTLGKHVSAVDVRSEDDDFVRHDDEKLSLEEQINTTFWYHTFTFPNGMKTNGQFDHSKYLHKYNFPDDLSGKTVLDVATFNGYWAFEFERRGALKVVGLDLAGPIECDFPPKFLATVSEAQRQFKFGRGFSIAHKLFDSKVEKIIANVYDLDPAIHGTFDVVHAGDFLVHLNSPVKALQNIAKVCNDYALISEVYFPHLDGLGFKTYAEYKGGEEDLTWWKLGLNTLKKMVLDAGFSSVEVIADFRYGPNELPEFMHHAVIKAKK